MRLLAAANVALTQKRADERSVVFVVLLVLMRSLQRFWKADLTAGATEG